MTIPSGTKVHLNPRSIDMAREFEDGIILIDTVLKNVIGIATYVLENIKQIPEIDKIPVSPSDLPFQITKELLVHQVKESANMALLNSPNNREITQKKVSDFFKQHFSLLELRNPSQKGIDLFKIHPRCQNRLQELREYLQTEYYQYSGLFKKIDLEEPQRDFSCFLFVFDRLKLLDDAKRYFIEIVNQRPNQLSILKKNTITNQDCVNFLLSQKYHPADEPLKKDDVVIYYDMKGPTHAALVANETHNVYAKFGSHTSFAYQHNLLMTPLMYGQHYLILRK